MNPHWWPQERTDRMLALWHTGMSARCVADELGIGVSRNAVIGKLFRLGLSNSSRPVRPRAAPPPKSKREPKPQPVIVAPPPPPPPAIDITDRPTIATVRPGRCRYPLDDLPSADMRVCGAVAVTGRSWCRECQRIVFQPHWRTARTVAAATAGAAQ